MIHLSLGAVIILGSAVKVHGAVKFGEKFLDTRFFFLNSASFVVNLWSGCFLGYTHLMCLFH